MRPLRFVIVCVATLIFGGVLLAIGAPETPQAETPRTQERAKPVADEKPTTQQTSKAEDSKTQEKAKAAGDEKPKTAPPAEDPNDAEAIACVERYLEAIGGRETLQKINDKSLHFTNKKFEPTGVTEMKMARFQKRDYKIREEWELPISLGNSDEPLRFLQVYDGDKAFVKAMGYVSPLTGKTLTVFLWDKPIDDAFLHWKDDGYTLRYIGEADLEGKPVDMIEQIAFAGNQRIRHHFSKGDGLLLKKEWTEDIGNGLTKKEVFYSDYVKIPFANDKEKSIKIATVERIFEDGELSLEKAYTEILVNSGLDDSIFARPEGPDFEERPIGQRPQPGAEKPSEQPTSRPTTRPKKDDG